MDVGLELGRSVVLRREREHSPENRVVVLLLLLLAVVAFAVRMVRVHVLVVVLG